MHPNLFDHLQTFQMVIEEGSFSAAAGRLGRTVSAIAYQIGQLEAQLDLTLFDRSGYRPELTETGKALLRDAEMISRKVERFTARAASLRRNIAVNATIMADPYFPAPSLCRALGAFARARPQMQLTLLRQHRRQISAKLVSGEARIGFLALSDDLPMRHVDGRQLAIRDSLLVASPAHPLAQMNRPFPLAELDNHRQIILSPDPVDSSLYNYHVHVTDLWVVDQMELMAALVREGAGWAYMPREAIEGDLADGRLVPLPCSDIPDAAALRLAAVWPASKPPDEALEELISLVESQCRAAPTAVRLEVG